MTPKRKMPTDQEMRRWSVENPEDGPEEPVADRAMTAKEEAAHRKRIAELGKEAEADDRGIRPHMSADELRAAGVGIAVPSEAASSDPKDIAYDDGTTLLGRLRKRKTDWEANNKRRTGGSGDGGSSS